MQQQHKNNVQMKDSNSTIFKRLNFSGATNATELQKFIESNIVHRQGFTYGAPNGKKFSIFVDDLDSPIHDKFGVQKSNEVGFESQASSVVDLAYSYLFCHIYIYVLFSLFAKSLTKSSSTRTSSRSR